MLNKAFTKKKKWITGAVASGLALAIVATGIYQSSEAALAKASLPKIEKYNQENGLENPFTILEIAPSYADAKIGYLVNGQEPAYYDENGVKAIADMGSAEERKERYSTNSASFGSALHNFSAFSSLNGKAFDYSDFDETSSDTKTKSFTTYGEFKQVATGNGDYLDLRNLDTTYVQLGETSVTMADVLKLSDDRTQHSLYSDDIVFEFRSAASTEVGYKLTFQEYSAVTDNTVRIPFKTVADYDTDVAGDETLFNWFYYLKDAKIAPVKTDYDTAAADYKTEHPNGATAIYTLNNTFPQDKITAIYRKYNGDSYTYMGYVFYDSTDSAFKYQPVINGSAAILVNGEDKDSSGNDQTTWAAQLIGDTDEYYTIRYYSDLNDSDRMNERLYVSQVEKTNTTDVDANGNNLAAVSATVAKKTIRISAGDEPSERLISIEDPLTYHVFYYLPSTTDEFAYYYDDDATTRAANKDKTTHNFVSDFTKAENETIKYNGGFTNKEWFKQYVLDLVYNATDSTKDECSKSVVDVITKLPSDVTVDDITNADLIYIQGGNYTVTKDMTTATAKALVESIGKDMPIVVEGELLYDGVCDSSAVTPAVKNGSDSNPLTNLYTLVFALEQSSLVDKSLADYITDWDTLPTKYANSRLQAKNQSYTNRTVFVFNGDSQVTGKSIVCADFVKTLSGDSIKNSDGTVIYDSYKEVREDISQERFYLNVAKSTAEFNEAISIATCIRHIISFGDRRVTSKDALRVLDIEPFYSPVVEANPETLFGGKYTYKNSNGEFVELSGVVYDAKSRDIMSTNWIKKYIGTQITDDSKITIKGMGTREFVSNIQDLNETYDLIYIGLDTQYLNTDISTIDGKYVKSNKTVYNDSTMDGLVYTHIGDLFNGDNAKDNKGMATKGTNYRGSGNDLTFEKTRELQSYVEAGYAVIFSDDFFVYDRTTGAVTGVNNATIDEKSYMHDFAQWVINNNYIGKNVSVKKNFVTDENVNTTGNSVVANREDFKQYLSISKLNVEIIDNVQPQAYYVNTNNANVYSTDNYHYLKMNSDGVYTLDFKVKLTNDAAVDTSNTTYDCKLFIDHDADGRYEDIEALNGLIIKDANNNDVDQSLDNGAYKFHLTTGTTYSITRRVPDGYVGFLPWKLVFYENNRIFATTSGSSSTNLVKTAIEGYSAIYDTSDRPEINILQITSGKSLATNLNLKETKMEQLYQEVKDFEIKVDQVSIRNLIANDNNAVYTGDVLDYLMNYDMLVLGFADSYNFWHIDKDDKVVWALRQYTLSGRSILYTHDLNSTNDQYSNDVKPWGTLANKYLRDVQGMDRYGVTASQLSTLSAKYGAFVADYKSRYDNDVYLDIFGNPSTKSTKNGSLIDRYGWNNTTLLRYHYTNEKPNGYGDISIQEFNGLQHTDEYVTDKVTRTNKGQITEYPFHIPEEITVADTHPQYFQLNLDTDTKDTNYDDDIVVWYTISNQNNAAYGNDNNKAKTNYYTFDYNDARNNYYIYNKGNITYTGAGHSSIGADREDERRLFVNTLVAAYNAGDHAPIAKFRQYPREMANDIDAMYEPFDVNLRNAAGKETGGYIEENVSVYFKTVNNNLQNNAVVDSATGMITYKTINAQYYVEAKEGDAGAIKIGNDYYKIIGPVSMKKNVNSNGIELTGDAQNVTSYYALDNYSIYTVEFDIDDLMTTTTSSDKVKLDKHNVKIFIRLSVDTPTVDSTVTEKYTDGTTKTETRQGMNHSLDVLPGSDSLNELTINFTELYELK